MKRNRNIARRFLLISQLVLLTFASFSIARAAAGDVDTSFAGALVHVPAGTIYKSVVQPDGKIILTGSFGVVGSSLRKNIVRLNADGSVDTTFNAPILLPVGSIPPTVIEDIGLQSNGKILLTGQFTTPRQGLIRLNADGSMDTAFNAQPLVSNVWIGFNLKVMPDDSFYYTARKLIQSSFIEYIVRSNSEGIPQEETPMTVNSFDVQPDGKILIFTASNSTVRRLNAATFTPSYDPTFAPVQLNSAVYSIAIQPDGKIILGGAFNMVNGFTLRNAARINTDGSIDASFNTSSTGPNGTIHKVLLMPDGKILISGSFTTVNGAARYRIALLNADGTLDNSFSVPNNFSIVYDLDSLPDGNILASGINAGTPGPGANNSKLNLLKFSLAGTPDDTFQVLIGLEGKGFVVRVQPDNKILVGGDFAIQTNGVTRRCLVRFNPDGTVDTSFNQTTFNGIGPNILDIQPDGKIIAGINVGSMGPVYRLNPDGSVNFNYSNATLPFAVKALPDGKLLISRDWEVTRFNPNGSIDRSFSLGSSSHFVYALGVQADGKVIIGGIFTTVAGQFRGRIARLNADLTFDPTFNTPGGVNGTVYSIAVQADGKIIIGGDFTGVQFDSTKKYLARLNTDGSLDASFAPVLNMKVRAIEIEPNGKVIIGGLGETGSIFTSPGKIAKLNTDGTFDSSFNNSLNISVGSVAGIDLQSNGKIIVVGYFSSINGIPALGIARLLNASRTMFDFDGDSKTDLSIFRPSNGEWWYYRSSDGGNFAAQFGASTDKLVPGDFTGDGKTDIAIFRPSTGEWFILRSEDGSYYSFPFGTTGDIPAVGDFDGDGRADAAVFRPSDSTWYILRSTGGTIIQQFGQSGDVPAVADYDGDGKSDIAIYRPSVGEWWIYKSSNSSVIAFQFGNNADKPVQGDYTGDGKADVAIFRPGSGEWYILRSEDFSYYSFPFGTSTDVPAPGDYDGDGKFDATVFRPSESTWYSQRSTAGTLIQTFGQSGDVAVPNAFVP